MKIIKVLTTAMLVIPLSTSLVFATKPTISPPGTPCTSQSKTIGGTTVQLSALCALKINDKACGQAPEGYQLSIVKTASVTDNGKVVCTVNGNTI